jgi:chitinase
MERKSMIQARGILAAAVLALAASHLWLAVATAEAKTVARSSGKKVVIGYVFPRKGRLPEEPIRGDLLTHLNFAFANIKNGEIVAERPDDPANIESLVALRNTYPHLKVLISVGGWSWSGGFSDMALSKASRGKFIDSAVAFLRRHKLDGLDLDWEYPGLPGAGNSYRPEDKKNFTLLLAETRKALDVAQKPTGRRYLLTIAAGASASFLEHTEMRKAQKYLDYVNLMTYDFFVEGGGKSGHHSNLYPSAFSPEAPSGAASVNAFLRAGVPARKLVLGVPFYGRGWKGAKPENNGLYQQAAGAGGGFSWNNLVQSYISKAGYTRWWDSGAKAPYLWKTDEGRVVTYDDPDSLREKCLFIKKRKLAGAMFWEYSADDAGHTLLRSLHEGLN